MFRKKTILTFVALWTLNLQIAFSQDREISILFLDNDQQDFYRTYFQLNDIEYTDEGIYLSVLCSTGLLKNILQIENLKIDVIRSNINNAKTTRTTKGGPYKRLYVDISLEDGVIINEDTESEGRFNWDPTHPDAIKEGERVGHVLYPNIDLEYEYHNLNISLQLFNGIVDYIQRNNIGIIVDKMPINAIEELRHQTKIERMIEIYLRMLLEEENLTRRH